ncbi:MAG: AAA family ATPase [Deltaproteobacteria bacterium]|nr:AAA family ATPase [Deltaproteobacteria bacterium]
MRCANCRTELIPGKQFCHACGARAPRACASCGSPIEPGFRFCPECGAPTSAEAAGSAPPADAGVAATRPAPPAIPETLAAKIRASQGVVAGERKLVTVMFCDLVGSTSIAERLDPEEFRDLLDEYMAVVFREVYRVEGIVTHLAGDGVMAVFGAPIAHEDAPYRAVYSALAIRDALGAMNARGHGGCTIDLQVRIGVHTGPVVVGTVGSDLKMDYTAIGDTTNLAQRLQSVADPGMVLISDATHRLVRGFFEVLPARRFAVKGKREPILAHEVRGLSATTTAIAVAEARGLTPLVGRTEELAQLIACFDRLAGAFPQVVTIVGDAGSGKSRLIYEFKQRLAEVPVVFFEARCSAMTQAVPYAPWVAMLRQYFGIASDDGEAEACAKISGRLGAGAGELAGRYPSLCQVLNLGGAAGSDSEAFEDEASKREHFEAVAELVYQASHQTPVVMIIEDVHWIDEPSREMLTLAVGTTRRERLMMLMSHRTEHQPGWRVKSAFTQLTLGALSDEETVDVVRGVAGGPLPAQLERRIAQKAEGNPFFAEEITRSLVEEGYLLRSDGHVRLTRPVDEIRMPGTVEDLVSARLDRLGAQAKRVVQVAAVLGRQFQREQLRELLVHEGIDVNAELALLEERGIIHRKSLLVGDEFRFGESLIQEVAYEGLLLRQRRELHDRIGRMIEALPGEPTAERSALLAHHYSRSENRDKAIGAVLHAARDAERVPSFRTAARFYRGAYDLATAALAAEPDAAEHKRVVVEAAFGVLRMSVIYGIFEDGDVEEAARRGRQVAEELGDAESLAEICSLHGLMISSRGPSHFPSGQALIEQALGIAERAELELTTTRISRALGWNYLFDGRFADARARIDGVIGAVERLATAPEGRRRDIYLGAVFMRDRIRFHADDLEHEPAAVHETYEAAVAYPNRTVQSGSAVTLSLMYLARGNYERAREWADRSLEIARAIGSASHLRSAAALGILARHELDEPIGGDRHLELIETPRLTGLETLSCQIICEALLAIDEVTRAEQCAERSYRHAGGRLRELSCSLALGDVATRLGPSRWADATRWYERAYTLAEAIGSHSGLAATSLGRALLAQVMGDAARATRHAEVARAAYTALGYTRDAAKADRILAEVGAESRETA